MSAVISSPEQRTSKAASAGWVLMFALAFAGLGVLAWSLWKLGWMTTSMATVGGLAAVALPVAGAVLGRVIVAGRPHVSRITAGWAGAAIGGVCLFMGSITYVWGSMVNNL
ncbi:hypothetical protein GBF35_12270 [Nonomuraea phyllanthi]|uniref:hypothetical protein n=1 Tax=Nonomuraea phyllanthi TaxID=2219224 RepID=UPI001293A1B0|nr:hypothetical protein [Nonomuraea phyllanthi]QFY07357.1 hypothetical protein GBF35_12270 [Nonomuraea phyllanthi]